MFKLAGRNGTNVMRRVMAFALILAAAPTACNPAGGPGGQSRMFVSSEEFNRGREDGRRDAKMAWSDDSAAWSWLWMTDAQYQQGYRQGWREGRAEVKFELQQQEARDWQDAQQAEQETIEDAN